MYRVGNGRDGYRTNSEIPDTSLPFKVTEGEYEIIVEHDVSENMLSRIQINGVDITDHWTLSDRKQRIAHGFFGIRASMDAHGSGVRLQQFYWYYRVEVDQTVIAARKPISLVNAEVVYRLIREVLTATGSSQTWSGHSVSTQRSPRQHSHATMALPSILLSKGTCCSRISPRHDTPRIPRVVGCRCCRCRLY